MPAYRKIHLKMPEVLTFLLIRRIPDKAHILETLRLQHIVTVPSAAELRGNATASGAMPTSGHTVAMAGVPFGTQLLINGTVYTVEDLGTPYGHVDIYFDSHAEALSFGLQYADVYQLN